MELNALISCLNRGEIETIINHFQTKNSKVFEDLYSLISIVFCYLQENKNTEMLIQFSIYVCEITKTLSDKLEIQNYINQLLAASRYLLSYGNYNMHIYLAFYFQLPFLLSEGLAWSKDRNHEEVEHLFLIAYYEYNNDYDSYFSEISAQSSVTPEGIQLFINSFQNVDENKSVASLQSKDPKLLTKIEKELLDIYKTLN